ncbi:MAG: Ig-like domain-containing protein [Nitrososphaerales archaeon]
MLVSFVFLAIGLSTITTGLTSVPVFADKDKNQKLSPKTECAVDTDVKDRNKNTAIGPIDLQCNSTNSNIRDSTVIQNQSPNGGFESFLVISTNPSDGDNNVPVDLSEIKVKFNKNIDKNSVDTGSLALFADNCGNAICNDPNIQDVSVSDKSVTFTIDGNDRLSPDTNYIASLLSSIQDEDGNSLDCVNSKGIDDNCEWNFSTSGSSANPTISINPTSGPVLTSVTVTGNGFDPISNVVITFDGSTVAAVTSNSNGGFTATFNVPLSSSIGDHTVKASQGSNSASKTFKVTALVNPIIFLDPKSGPVGGSVNITGSGFAPTTAVVISFNGTAVTTTPSPLKPNSNGIFFANFTVPQSSIGPVPVIATQGSNSASKTFTVTLESTSLAATSQSSTPNLSEKMILPDIFA